MFDDAVDGASGVVIAPAAATSLVAVDGPWPEAEDDAPCSIARGIVYPGPPVATIAVVVAMDPAPAAAGKPDPLIVMETEIVAVPTATTAPVPATAPDIDVVTEPVARGDPSAATPAAISVAPWPGTTGEPVAATTASGPSAAVPVV
jgi:hypothetical protein